MNSKNQVSLILNGGTISSLKTKRGYRQGGLVFDLLPKLQKIYPNCLHNIGICKTQILFTGLSENITVKDWDKLISAIKQNIKEYNSPIVITCGTDAMEQTAKYLQRKCGHLLEKEHLRIILTGANDDISEKNTDAWRNLLFALKTAISSKFNGVYVSFHEKNIPAYLTTKEPFNGKEMNYISVLDKRYLDTVKKHHEKSKKIINELHKSITSDTSIDNKVLLYKVNKYRRNHDGFLKKIATGKFKVVLLILYHSGSANTDIPKLSVSDMVKEVVAKYGTMFFATSENDEYIDLHKYSSSYKLLKAGVIPLYNMTSEVALEKLKLVSKNSSNITIDQMLNNYVGEIDKNRIMSNDIKYLKKLYCH